MAFPRASTVGQLFTAMFVDQSGVLPLTNQTNLTNQNLAATNAKVQCSDPRLTDSVCPSIS